MASDWTNALPSVDGPIEAGIAVAIDQVLANGDKLPVRIVEGESFLVSKAVALRWAHQKAVEQFKGNSEAISISCNSVHALYNTCALSADDSDVLTGAVGQVFLRDTSKDDIITPYVTLQETQKALSVIVATKISYWLTNHHTGQGRLEGYVKKAIDLLLPDSRQQELKQLAYMADQWASTKIILNAAGIKHIKHVELLITGKCKLVFSDDAKLRLNSLPAGTHRLNCAYTAAKKLSNSLIQLFTPDITQFAVIEIIDNVHWSISFNSCWLL